MPQANNCTLPDSAASRYQRAAPSINFNAVAGSFYNPHPLNNESARTISKVSTLLQSQSAEVVRQSTCWCCLLRAHLCSN